MVYVSCKSKTDWSNTIDLLGTNSKVTNLFCKPIQSFVVHSVTTLYLNCKAKIVSVKLFCNISCMETVRCHGNNVVMYHNFRDVKQFGYLYTNNYIYIMRTAIFYKTHYLYDYHFECYHQTIRMENSFVLPSRV